MTVLWIGKTSTTNLLFWLDEFECHLWQLCLDYVFHHEDLPSISIDRIACGCDEKSQQGKVQVNVLCLALGPAMLLIEHELGTLDKGLDTFKEVDISLDNALIASWKIHNTYG